MRGLAAFLVIAVVFVTVDGRLYYRTVEYTTMWAECGVKEYVHRGNRLGKYNSGTLFKEWKMRDPMRCLKWCRSKRPRCKAFNLREHIYGSYVCQLLRTNGKIKTIPRSQKGTRQYYSYTGLPRCSVTMPKCFEKNCYRSRGHLVALGSQDLGIRYYCDASGNSPAWCNYRKRRPHNCQDWCKKLVVKGMRCTHTSYEWKSPRLHIKCWFYHLKRGGNINNYRNWGGCSSKGDPYNRWMGPATCPNNKRGTVKRTVNM